MKDNKFTGYKTNGNDNGIRLNANESSKNIYKDVIDVNDLIGDLNRYPELGNDEIKKLYANFIGVSKANVICGSGSDEMLNLIIGYRITKENKVMTLSPDFSMYDFFTYFNKGNIVKYKVDSDCTFDMNLFIKAAKKENPDLIIFSNPNNPTGNLVSRESIIELLNAFPDIDIVIDEAYIEFADESVVDLIEQYKNLVVLRTMSKAWGLAGIRLGFLISCKSKIKEILKYDVPYNISSITQKIGIIALNNSNIMLENIKEIKNERDILFDNLKMLEQETGGKILFYKSYANFIYGESSIKDEIIQQLNIHGIYIRDFAGTNNFRISVGSNKENRVLIEVLDDILKEERRNA